LSKQTWLFHNRGWAFVCVNFLVSLLSPCSPNILKSDECVKQLGVCTDLYLRFVMEDEWRITVRPGQFFWFPVWDSGSQAMACPLRSSQSLGTSSPLRLCLSTHTWEPFPSISCLLFSCVDLCVAEKETGGKKGRRKGGGGSKKDEVLLYFLNNILRKGKSMLLFLTQEYLSLLWWREPTWRICLMSLEQTLTLCFSFTCLARTCIALWFCFVTVLRVVHHVLIYILGKSSAINESSAIIYSPSCCSKPVYDGLCSVKHKRTHSGWMFWYLKLQFIGTGD